MTYGLECIDLEKKNLLYLENAHQTMAKKIQGLPVNCPNICAYAPLGWKSAECVLIQKSLLMLWQILLLPMTSIYKQLVIYRFLQHHHFPSIRPCGPVRLMISNAKQLALLDVIMASITSGTYMPITQWKSELCSKLSAYDRSRWLASCQLYPSLYLYRTIITDISIWPWWQYVSYAPHMLYKCKYLIRIIVSNKIIMSYNKSDKSCKLCGQYVNSDAAHVLFVCSSPRICHIRSHFWRIVERSKPHGLCRSMNAMAVTDRTQFILSGFRCKFVVEWADIYHSLCTFVYNIINVTSSSIN